MTPDDKPRDWQAQQEQLLGDRQRPGAVAAVGKRTNRMKAAALTFGKAIRRHGLHCVLRSLRVHDTTLLELCGWFWDIERQAAEDLAAAGGPRQVSRGGGEGLGLTRAMMLRKEVPVLLRRLMEDPRQVLKDLDA